VNLTFEEKYNAIGRKESDYEGIFITAVRTTGIFCRPSCRARKPLAKNVTFYDDAQEALKHGYRPCKICRPMGQEGLTPTPILDLIRSIHDEPYRKISDTDLRQMGLEPNRIRRWFKANHNLTFHGYQRLIRINSAFRQIQEGATVTNAAFDSGFESLSGFNDGYKAIFGDTPTKSGDKAIIYIDRFTTDLGAMFVCATGKGICLLEFSDRRMLESEFKDLRRRLNAVIVPGTNEHIEQAKNEVIEFLAGNLKEFKVITDSPGTEFQQEVWELLKTIPYGETRSYKEQAIGIGKPKAVRAVANANGMNRISLVIPCHRVIGSDGSLTGYGGGLPRKQWLLNLEVSNVE
jgi:AraC family transcriptional regulator, regulatory protein of adaptative response / methylated-DNA-[protein]-cysteine methyltransferase